MELYEKFLLILSVWTLAEGGTILFFPNFSLRFSRKLFPKWSRFLEEFPAAEMRKLGGIEFIFGLFLGGYLYFMT